jgi:hypothetical protein
MVLMYSGVGLPRDPNDEDPVYDPTATIPGSMKLDLRGFEFDDIQFTPRVDVAREENFSDRRWDAEKGAWVSDGPEWVPDPGASMPLGLQEAARMARQLSAEIEEQSGSDDGDDGDEPDERDGGLFNFEAGGLDLEQLSDIPVSRLPKLPPSGRKERAVIYTMLAFGTLMVFAAWLVMFS